MDFIKLLENAAKGTTAGMALVAALPVCGPVGVATACGVAVGSVLGAAAGAAATLLEEDHSLLEDLNDT